MLADEQGEMAEFYVTFRWHVARCVFSWRKMVRAGSRATVLEGRCNKDSYVKHYGNAFLGREIGIRVILLQGLRLNLIVGHVGSWAM